MVEIILTKPVTSLGDAGDLVRVRPGYARNYLIPRKLGLLATRDNIAQLEHHKRAIAAEQAKIREEYSVLAKVLENTTVSIARKKGKDEKLFGSVTNKDIVEALAAQNIEIDRKFVRIEDPIKVVGTHGVVVRFMADVQVELKVNVIGI